MFDTEIYQVQFAGNVLNDIPGVEIYLHNFNDLPDREININKLARRDLSIITSAEYSSKNLYVYADVCSGGRADTEDTVRQLKSLVQAINAQMIVRQAGLEISYTSTLNEFSINWFGTTANVTMVFIASDPVGYETSTTKLLDVNTTASTANFTEVIGGSYIIQPTINVTLNTVTGGTGGTLTIRNAKTGQGISVTRDWIDDDILSINSATKDVSVNGTPVDFTGMFPIFSTGTQIVGYVDNFTTRDADITGTYVKRII